MLRIPFIYLLYASIFSIVLTSVVMSTQAGGCIARITLFLLPGHQRRLHLGIYHFHTVLPILYAHFLWGLAAVYLYRKQTKPGKRPSETEK
ncbi:MULTISPECIES: hypothetical protein [unclassified Neisseria]|uniref:hypothetical protein n=1 Tax=unclassified Neisseria TaxID=2623750 RepID=UPI0010721371|nr:MULTISPECIES: hypothetical protein [unclassified Neisseria]MBF0803742.1 hypothetical protein [Neisseria sp. 19428wB4_WF04]TFU43566.1 hypothetical protein E4T99_05130 [Neisseria sp. WF04]